jgi:transcriptional regulator with XRE-family HTH domain
VTGAGQEAGLTGAEQVRQMRQSLGRELAARRREAGYSQRQLAPLTGYARSTLSDAELGRHHVRRDFWERCQRLLRAGAALTGRYDQIEAVAAAWRAAAVRAAQARREERAAREEQAMRERAAGDEGAGRLHATGDERAGRARAARERDPAAGQAAGEPAPSGRRPAAAGDGDPAHAPASIVTVQQCPACGQSLAVITVLAVAPR